MTEAGLRTLLERHGKEVMEDAEEEDVQCAQGKKPDAKNNWARDAVLHLHFNRLFIYKKCKNNTR